MFRVMWTGNTAHSSDKENASRPINLVRRNIKIMIVISYILSETGKIFFQMVYEDAFSSLKVVIMNLT